MRRRRHPRVVAYCVAAYVLLVALSGAIARAYAVAKTDDLLKFAVKDFSETLDDTLNYILSFVAYSLEDELGSARPLPQERMAEYARIFNVDEINVAGTNGRWIASTETDVAGLELDRTAQTAAYLSLLNAGVQRVFQPFRVSAADPSKRRKYIGLPFVDGSGVIQIGLNESRVVADSERIFYGFMEHWNVGDQRFYIIADGGTGKVLAYDEKRFGKAFAGRRLSDLGFPSDAAADPSTTPTGSVTLDGVPCRFRMGRALSYVLIALIPDREFYGARLLMVAMPAILLGVALAVFLLVLRAQRKSRYAELRLRAERLHRQRQDQRRQADDLLLARDIQRSSLPSVFPPYPRDLTIDLFADMTPARDVGGDFYDFFYTGAGRLAVLVADVSGKGVPAAMFMMKAKSILRELALSKSDLGEAVTVANERLCEGNETSMFVTCWIGVLDEDSGVLRYVNAGHTPPCVRRADGSTEPLADLSGMFLGGMEDIRYRTFSTRLRPGDLLFLYTDGVTEANDVKGGMFGEARLMELLRAHPNPALAEFEHMPAERVSPARLCRLVRETVNAFAGKAAQFDDITLLALLYRGQPRRWELELPATLKSVPEFSAFAEKLLIASGCPQPAKADLLVALDEITNNVARYSGSERMRVVVELAVNPAVVRFSVIDKGTPWNPLEHLDPDITRSADEREIGGLGILMVKKLMDDVSYANVVGSNVLRFRKAF